MRRMLAGVLALATAAPIAPARGDALHFTDRQEATLAIANRVTAAALRCDFAIDHARLEAMLSAAGIGWRDMETRRRSDALSQDVATYIRSFRNNKGKVCAAALALYGPGGAAGAFLSK